MVDAVLVVSYGGPRGPEDVLPFMRNATRGRGIPDERLVEVSGHYQRFGGVSPINERNAELMDALGEALRERGLDVPVVIGNRNWTPYLADTLRELAASGLRDVRVVITAAYSSYSGCRQYREDLAGALAELGEEAEGFTFTKIGPYAETDGFVGANARALVAAVRELGGAEDLPAVLFVTHSIPTAMDAASGPGGEEGTYHAQHLRVAEAVAREASAELGVEVPWELVFCSRSGAPHIPWLEPDVNDRLEELAADGVERVVTAPIGFINDHMEVVFDLDTEARETAEGLGLGYVRAATVGVDPGFVALLADAVVAGERGTIAGMPTCGASCCGSGRPGAGAPTVLDNEGVS
ncbi:ferrochelatase [Propioniciclava soli]|uniref:Coproporphyrin III ferrochelatase n=1 Tax=Propioniciclava soli TaxID=2775081 RepID=A0ABZ3C7W7_9ACTN|nr:ferrochelatase [Propioniciclava soli]